MMPEIIDNFSQFFVVFLGSILSGVLYLKSRRQPYFILTCFYSCFALAGLYWMLYTILITDTPSIFYVADIGWIAGFVSVAGFPITTGRAGLPMPGDVACPADRNTADALFYQYR